MDAHVPKALRKAVSCTGRRGAGLVLGLLLVPATLAAQPAAPKAPKKSGVVAVSPELGKKLKSDDPAEVQTALDEIRISGPAASHLGSDVAALLERGTSRALTESALETLGDIEAESVAASVALYASHRDVKLRRVAIQTLARMRGPIAVKVLKARLRDPDGMIRGTAASALGAMKAKDALPDLFVALDHRIGEAAASIGQLCGPKECEELAARVGRQPFEVMTGGFDQILFRPASEIPEDAKVKLIGRIRELGTAEANKFLRDVQKRMKAPSPRLKQVLEQAITATGGGG